MPRTQATVLDVGRGSIDLRSVLTSRTTVQATLVVLALVASAALIVSRVQLPRSGVESVALPPAPTTSTAVSASPAAPPSPSATPTLPVSATGSARQQAARHYRIRRGDTLAAIAARFSVTVKALAAANGVRDPARIRVGDVLSIP